MSRPPRLTIAMLALGIALGVAACGTSPASSPPPAIPPVDTSLPPTPAPTVSAAAAAFMARQATFAKGSLPFAGTLATEGGTLRIDGRYDIDGADWYGIRTATDESASPEPVATSVEKIRIGTRAWTRITGGPWIENLKEAARTSTLPGFLAALPPVADHGVGDHSGRQLHQLELQGDATVPPAVFGLDVAGLTGQRVTLSVWATDNGTPVAMTFDLVWVGAGVHGTTNTEEVLEFDCSKLGQAVTVAAPEKPWQAVVSDGLGYSVAVPFGYARTASPGEDRYGVGATTTLWVRQAGTGDSAGATPGASVGASPNASPGASPNASPGASPNASPGASPDLDAALATATAAIAKETGVAPISTTEGGLGDVRARIVESRYTTAGVPTYRLDAVAIRHATTWQLTFVVPAGTTDQDAAQHLTFEQILATFVFTR